MRGVAAQKNAALAHAVGNQTPRDPVLLGEKFILKAIVDPEHVADRAIPIDHREVGFVRFHPAMDQPQLLAVDRNRVA